MSSSETFPAPTPEPPILRVNNVGSDRLTTSPLMHASMGRRSPEAESLGFEEDTASEKDDINIEPNTLSYGERLIDAGIYSIGWKLASHAREALNGVGYSDDELDSMTPELVFNIVNSGTGDIAFDNETGESPEQESIDEHKRLETIPDLGKVGVMEEISVERIATEENLPDLINHIRNGGSFTADGVAVRVEIFEGSEGRKFVNFFDSKTSRKMTGNMSLGRIGEEFSRKVLEEGRTYVF